MIYCVMNTGGTISNGVSIFLFENAKVMARKNQKSRKLRGRECSGMLTTSWKSSSLGTIYGTEFVAEVLVGGRESTITFIVQGQWLDQTPNGSHVANFADEAGLNEFAAQDAMREDRRRFN